VPSRRQLLGTTAAALAGTVAGCTALGEADLRVSNNTHLERTLTIRISRVENGPEPTDESATPPTAVDPYTFNEQLSLESNEDRTFAGLFENGRRYAATVTSDDAVRSTDLIAGDGVQLRVGVDSGGLRVYATT
jgi:hypothetical protein